MNIFIRPTLYFCSLVNNEFFELILLLMFRQLQNVHFIPFVATYLHLSLWKSPPPPTRPGLCHITANPTNTHSLSFSQRVSVRPLHRDYKRDADEHGLPAHTRSRDGAAAASGAGQAVFRCCGTAACGGRYRWVLFAPHY